uniref:NAD(P)H-binding protein n=1 Tax=Gemmatimonas sp. TaxID=1962908 RepID=UPI00286E38AA
MTVLITGATGYIGGRLTPRLVELGLPVRVFVRDAKRIRGRWWEDRVEVVTGDLMDPVTVARALEGADTAYYLDHSMTNSADCAARDRIAARNVVNAGRELR